MHKILVSISLVLIISSCSTSKYIPQNPLVDPKVDLLFSGYIDALQRLNDGSGTDYSDEEIREIITFLGESSGIKPKLDDTFIVVSGVTQSSLEAWKAWYFEHQETLKWKEVNKLLKQVQRRIS